MGDPYETVIDGQQAGTVVTAPDSASYPYRLDGFTVRNGKTDSWGGGISSFYEGGNKLTVENCTITRNSAGQGGGGVCCNLGSSARLVRCTISENYSGYGGDYGPGGGIFIGLGCNPEVVECIISGNMNEQGGGGIYILGASPRIIRCVVVGNAAPTGAGIVSWDVSSPLIFGCIISGNRGSLTDGWGGGGIFWNWWIWRNYPSIINCTITYNACIEGGAICAAKDGVVVNNIIAYNNTGVFFEGTPDVFRNNCVWGNGGYNYKGAIGDRTGLDGNISVDPKVVGGTFTARFSLHPRGLQQLCD